MGFFKIKQYGLAQAWNEEIILTSTAAIIQNRVVKITSGGGVKHTTGSSGRLIFGVATSPCTGSGKRVSVRYSGIVSIEASTKAIKIGQTLRATSGAASTASHLGGTVCPATASTAAGGSRMNVVGMALTSCAAGATKRTVNVVLSVIANSVGIT